jgi:hypothetical protein
MYSVIADDFVADLAVLSDLISYSHRGEASARARVASINSATLLLGATFEEFVRQLGRQFARDTVSRTESLRHLPQKFTATAWKRVLEHLTRVKFDTGGRPLSLDHISKDSRAKFDAVLAFLEGDLTQDIYSTFIHSSP